MKEENRTEISTLGEFGLIDHLADHVRNYHAETLKGIGDDAAVIRESNDQILVSTDMFIEGIHFDLSYFPLHHLGYKAIVANVSDIAAMNGIASHATISLGVSNRFSVEAVDQLYQGINKACEVYQVDLVGGDMTSAPSGLVLSVSIMGKAQSSGAVYRNGASTDDLVCVTGDLGGAYVGLQVLEREKQVFLTNPEMQPELEAYQYVVQRQLKPEARTDIIETLKELDVQPTAMIDISDGLASEIFHICKQSVVGVTLNEKDLPIDNQTYETAVEFNLDPMTCVLNGGEDYELLFTINPDDQRKLEKQADIHIIGSMNADPGKKILLTKKGQEVALQAQGWKHF